MAITETDKMAAQITGSACSTLRFVVNKECQLKCIWCYQEGIDHGHSKKNLSADTFIRIAQVGKDHGFTKVNFSGGEPLLHPDIFRIQREIARSGTQTYVTTNGALIDRKKAAEVWKTIPGLEVHVSVNTTDEKEYKDITGRSLLPTVLRGITQLVDAGIPFSINTVVSSENDWPTIRRVIDFAGETGTTVKLLGIHDAKQDPFSQKTVAEMVFKNGAQHTASSTGDGVNYGYEQFTVGQTRVHVLNMLYGGGCCDRFKSGQCGEGIRYPRVVYTGEVKPCLHCSSGVINNNSSDREIGDILEKAKQFIAGLSIKPFTLDSIRELK